MYYDQSVKRLTRLSMYSGQLMHHCCNENENYSPFNSEIVIASLLKHSEEVFFGYVANVPLLVQDVDHHAVDSGVTALEEYADSFMIIVRVGRGLFHSVTKLLNSATGLPGHPAMTVQTVQISIGISPLGEFMAAESQESSSSRGSK